MQKWNLLKKTAPCILSLAVAATTFPTAVMASDLDAAVVSEAEAGDTEDFSTEETAEDTEAVAEEAIEDAADITEEAAEDVAVPEAAADETEDIQQEDTEAVETLDETAEEADPFSTGEEDFTEGDEVAEAFSDSDQLTGEYQYVYAGLTWGEYWAAEGVYAAGDTSSSEEKDSHSEFDTGAFDTVTRATANHGLHRGSYQTEATIIAEDGTRFDVSYWEDKGSTLYLTDGSKVKWNRGSITTEDGKTYTMDHYEIYGLKYVPVAVKTADFADFCKKYNVVQDGAVLSGGYSENNLQYYKGLVADVNAQTNGLKYVEKNGDGFTFTARKSDGTASGIKDQALKTATEIKPSVKAASGSYGEFLRVDLNGNYGDLGANMQAVRWDYYGDDSTYTKCLASYGTKFAADNWMHKAMGIQLGLTKSARCKLPGGTDGTGYWKLTVYALGYNDYTYSFQATAENIVNPTMEPTDFTSLKTEVEAAKALAEADYTIATCKITVKASTIKFAKASVTIYKGKTATVKATATPSATVKYTSSNTKVATVNSKTGVVKGIKAGTVTITAKAGALKTTCKVVVKNPAFSLVKSSATIKKGKTTTIRSKAAPAGKVTYTSSNKKVAAVNSKGVVKGIKKGKATITVKCNGITKKFVVTVK